jgi:Domain of unknown function (DUF222)
MFEDVTRRLARVQPAELDDDALVDLICAWERLASCVAAGQLSAIAELARRRPREDGGSGPSEFAVDEVAAALRLSRPAAGLRLHVATELAQRLPGTATALQAGEIDVPKARAVVEATTPLEPAVGRAVEERVLPRAGAQTVGRLRASLARAVAAIDPGGTDARHERAVADRRVVVRPLPDGMAELWAFLPADAAASVYSAVDRVARKPGALGDGRTMDARRADALVELATRAAGKSGGAQPLVHVTVPVGTLIGLADEPGELAGYGPIPAPMARRLAADSTWRRILTDPSSGAVLDVGRTTYRPTPPLAEHVFARDRTCRFPGCRQPARRCDLDHVRPYPTGPTSAANLIALCRHHHRLKHRTRWRVQSRDDGTLEWTSPTGHRYRTEPAELAMSAVPRTAGRMARYRARKVALRWYRANPVSRPGRRPSPALRLAQQRQKYRPRSPARTPT